jgi:hypothetical protein
MSEVEQMNIGLSTRVDDLYHDSKAARSEARELMIAFNSVFI